MSGALVCFSLLAAAVLSAAESDIGALRAKAESGNAVAQYNLGIAYLDGHQVPKDVIEAYVWLTLAAESGARGKALKELTPTMSAKQIAEAEARLAERRGVISNNLLAQSGVGSSGATPAPRAVRTPDAAPPTTSVPVSVAFPPPAPAPVAAPAPAPAPAAVDRAAAPTKEMATLRSDNAKLSADLLAAWKELDAAKIAQTDAARKIDQAEAAAQKAAVDTRAIAAERDQLRQQLASALAAARTPAPAPDTMAQTKAAAELESARRELAAVRKNGTDLAAQVERLTGESAALKSQVSASRDTARKLEEAQAAVARLQTENAALKTRPAPAPDTTAQTKAVAAAEEARAKAAANLESVRRELAAVQKNNLDLAAQIERLAGESASLKTAVSASHDTARKLEEAQAAVARLQAEIAALKAKPAPPPAAEASPDELARLKQDLARAKETIEMTVRSFALTRQENEQLKARLGKIQQAIGGEPDAAAKPAH